MLKQPAAAQDTKDNVTPLCLHVSVRVLNVHNKTQQNGPDKDRSM